jgi:hypothetical protein
MLVAFFLSLASGLCPTITPMANFNTTEYIRSTWYVQEQQLNGYQKNNTLNCVAQTLNESSTTHVPFFDGPVISVYNYANIDHVNGPSQNNGNFTLCARQYSFFTIRTTERSMLVAKLFRRSLLGHRCGTLFLQLLVGYYFGRSTDRCLS